MPITPYYMKRPFHTGAEFPYALDSSSSNVRKSFKKFNIIGDLTWTSPEVYVMKRAFNSTGTLTPTTFTPVGNIQYNGTSYPLSFTDIGDYWLGTASITMSRSINPEFYLGLKCTGGVGTFDYPRSFVSSRLQNEGVLNDDGTGTDYSDGLMPYGAKATATVSNGVITGCSVTAGGWNYTATATVFAVEKINNVMYFKQIGTAAVSGGAVTSVSVTAGDATGTTPSGLAGWVNPEIRISYGRSGFTTSNAGAGFTALYVAARPNGNVASVAAIGDSLVKYTAAQADLIPTMEGYNGQYEIGVNGRAPVVNAGIGSGTAQNFANFATNYPILFRMLQLAHCNFGILAIGTNDIRNGRSAANVTTDMNTIVTQMRRMGMKVKTANVMPRTTSGTLTTPLDANFDVGGSVFTLNTNINNGTVSNDLGVIDSRGTFHNPANTVEWGGPYVTDGTHVRDAGLGVASGAGYTSQFSNVVGGTSSASAPFTPASISGLSLWLDASDTSTITQVANAVSQWNDKSGNGNHATQSTGANQPTTNTRTMNNLNVLDFDGSNDGMNLPAALYSIPNGSNTIFIVNACDVTTAGSRQTLTGESTPFTVNFGIQYGPIASPNYLGRGNTQISRAVTRDTNPHIFALRKGSVASLYYDGGTPTTGSVSNDASVNMTIGYSPSYGDRWDGVFGEILIFNRELSNSDMNIVGNYLKNKWNAPWTNL